MKRLIAVALTALAALAVTVSPASATEMMVQPGSCLGAVIAESNSDFRARFPVPTDCYF